MASPTSDMPATASNIKTVKVVVAGGYAAGKTTLVSAISAIQPFTTEAPLTEASIGVDDARMVSDRKRTTTVAMDFGRAELTDRLWLYMFGTPGQDRFAYMWDGLCIGAIGAIVLADSRRLEESFPALDYFERSGLPFIVAMNCFDAVANHRPEDVAAALDLAPHVPVVPIDARRKDHVKTALTHLVRHGIDRASANAPTVVPA